MDDDAVRDEVVRALTAAHQDDDPVVALVAAELKHQPTQAEKDAASALALEAREAAMRAIIERNARRAKELHDLLDRDS